MLNVININETHCLWSNWGTESKDDQDCKISDGWSYNFVRGSQGVFNILSMGFNWSWQRFSPAAVMQTVPLIRWFHSTGERCRLVYAELFLCSIMLLRKRSSVTKKSTGLPTFQPLMWHESHSRIYGGCYWPGAHLPPWHLQQSGWYQCRWVVGKSLFYQKPVYIKTSIKFGTCLSYFIFIGTRNVFTHRYPNFKCSL